MGTAGLNESLISSFEFCNDALTLTGNYPCQNLARVANTTSLQASNIPALVVDGCQTERSQLIALQMQMP
jgi:hypothetical protein